MTSYTKIYDWLYDVPELRLADIVIFSKIMRRLDLSKHNKKHFTDDRGVYCVYSLEDMAEAGKCSISIMSVQDPQSRQFFQELLGERKVLKVTSGLSGTEQEKGKLTKTRGAVEVREPVFQQGDFANLGDDVIVYANGKYIQAQKTYYFKKN